VAHEPVKLDRSNGHVDGVGRGRGRGAVSLLRDRLREAIVTGEIPASAARTQAQLAEALGVSRTPLREALRMLELEQLIIREPNGRFRAAGLSADEIEQLAVIRLTLEAAAIRLTVPALTDGDHTVLEGLYATSLRLSEIGEWSEFEAAHRRFHMLLTREAGAMHAEQLGRLWDQEARYRRAFENLVDADGRDEVSQQEHRAILDAVEARDAELSARLAAWHGARTVRAIGARLAPGTELHRLAVALQAQEGERSSDHGAHQADAGSGVE
jgi:DNA-binding GntR family transcriptional regulator